MAVGCPVNKVFAMLLWPNGSGHLAEVVKKRTVRIMAIGHLINLSVEPLPRRR